MNRIVELDGLRGIAVLLVIGFHVWPRVFVGGSYGVVVFFTISGFFITRSLVSEIDRHGKINYINFYKRRALRLMPALVLVATVYMAAGGFRSRALAAVTYSANYARINDFKLGAIHHTWSLAVEEHFYLLWPVALALIPARLRVRVLVALVGVFAGWRALIITVGATDWVYYGTDTNAVAILAGCLAAVVGLKPRSKWWVWLPVVLSVVVVHRTEIFHWAGLVVIAATVAVIACPPKWLGWKPLAYIGTVSYSLYLWHYMLLGVGIPAAPALTVTFLVTGLSWKYLEKPLLNRARRGSSAYPTEHLAVP